uniref:F-box domain-containing protein n=1 Tax=Aegilops tauschii TaxID=37682 RepID=M8BDD2_AEGTA
MENDQHPDGHQPNPPPPPQQLPDDVLRDIFHRLPSDPSALALVSSSYNAWRRVVHDEENFLRSFRAAHHGIPPLIGFYSDPFYGVLQFTPTTPPTPPLPPAPAGFQVYGCTHGRLLLGGRDGDRALLLVRDPLTGEEHSIPPAPGLLPGQSCGAALICDANHAKGEDCHSSPFRVVFAYSEDYPPGGWHPPMALISTFAWVYSSKKRSWGGRPAAAMGVKCYFDPKPSAVVDKGASVAIPDELRGDHFVLAPTVVDAPVGIAGVIENCVVLLSRVNGVEGWIPRIVARLDNLLPAGPAENGGIGLLPFEMGYADEEEDELADDWTEPRVIGVSEEGDTIFLQTEMGIFMVNSESGQHKRVLQADQSFSGVYPYSTFYTAAGKAVFDDVQQDQQNNNIQSGGQISTLGESSDGGAD